MLCESTSTRVPCKGTHGPERSFDHGTFSWKLELSKIQQRWIWAEEYYGGALFFPWYRLFGWL